jgi:hypothetical protein
VATKCARSGTMSAGLLSQSFLRSTFAVEVFVPIVSWSLQGVDGGHAPVSDGRGRVDSLAIILVRRCRLTLSNPR